MFIVRFEASYGLIPRPSLPERGVWGDSLGKYVIIGLCLIAVLGIGHMTSVTCSSKLIISVIQLAIVKLLANTVVFLA